MAARKLTIPCAPNTPRKGIRTRTHAQAGRSLAVSSPTQSQRRLSARLPRRREERKRGFGEKNGQMSHTLSHRHTPHQDRSASVDRLYFFLRFRKGGGKKRRKVK